MRHNLLHILLHGRSIMATNLIRRGGAYSCKVSIPRPLRHHFLNEAGKQREALWESLGPDLTIAKPKCAERVAYWEGIFARLRSGETLDGIKAADEKAEREARELREVLSMPLTVGEDFKPPQESLAHAFREYFARLGVAPASTIAPSVATPVEPSTSETVSQAAQALAGTLERDGRRQTTVDGHRLRVRAFVETFGDIPLSTITRRTASDFLDKVGENLSNRTRNAYAMTMALVIETARKRGRFQGENTFEGQKAKAVDERYRPFDASELRTLFAALPPALY